MILVRKTSKPSLVEKAKNSIIFLSTNNKCITHKMAKDRLTDTTNPIDRYSQSTFDEAWKYLRNEGVIVKIPKNHPNWKECRLETHNVREFYKLNTEKVSSLYSNLEKSIIKIDTPDKAFAFVDQLSEVYPKLDSDAFYEGLVSKFLEKANKIEFEDEVALMAFHFRLLDSIKGIHDYWDAVYDTEFLQRIHKEIDIFYSKVNDGSCNTVSALGIVTFAFAIIWKSDRNLGRSEFSRILKESIISLDNLQTAKDSADVRRNFNILQCYANNAPKYSEYFNDMERQEFFNRLQESYFSTILPVDFNLKMLIKSAIDWFASHL